MAVNGEVQDPPPVPKLVPDLLREQAEEEPDRVAMIVDGVGTMTYRDWHERSSATARGLVAKGVQPGDRVGLLYDNVSWLDYAVAYMATLKAGAVAVPLSTRFTSRELTSLLDNCGAVGVVVDRPLTASFDGWRATGHELESGQERSDLQAQVAPQHAAEILYTSGTTGTPKGVVCAHEHIVRPLVEGPDWRPDQWRSCAGGVYVHANAMSTAAGQLRLLEPLQPHRMTTLALPVFDPERMCHLIQTHQAAAVQLVPAMATSLLDTQAHRRHDLSTVQIVAFGCAPLPPAAVPRVAAAFPNSLLVNLYELSEARHVGTYAVYGRDQLGSVGRPRGATELRIVDETGRSVDDGTVGEVWLRWRGLGPQRYFGDPETSAAVFQEGWTRTGDAGYLDAERRLFLVDRVKDVIITGGLNVASLEVENSLYEHPAVAEVAVFGIPDQLEGEQVVAAVVLGSPVSVDDLRAFVRQRLAGYKIPRRFMVVDHLPRNRSGKPLKRELRANLLAELAAQEGVTKMSERERLLGVIWADVLNVQAVTSTDDFFDLGGNSLLATQVTSRVRDAFGVELPVTTMFEHRSLGELAKVVDHAMTHDGGLPGAAQACQSPAPAS